MVRPATRPSFPLCAHPVPASDTPTARYSPTRDHSSTRRKPRSRSSSRETASAFSFRSARSGSSSSGGSSNSDGSSMPCSPPTLTEILLGASPPPWTLTAFMAYLSHNHCMETLEFTLDAQRYSSYFDQLALASLPSREILDRVCAAWRKLMHVYIVPCAPREVNLPARVRDRLLSLPCASSPPHPSELDEAGRIIYELMNDSLLVPFLESLAPLQVTSSYEDRIRDTHAGRRRRRRSITPALTKRRTRPSASPQPLDSDGLTDDSDSISPSAPEPMTPPMTPPTPEYTFYSASGGLQRAMAAHSKGWKKVGAKLGFSRKGVSRRSTPTSCSDLDASAE